MRIPLRQSSLLWTFSAAFLGVLVLGALLQIVIAFGVIRPAARHWLHSQGEVLARAGAQAVGTALERDPDARVPEVLASVTSRAGLVFLVYRDATGRFAGSDRPLGGRWRNWRLARGRLRAGVDQRREPPGGRSGGPGGASEGAPGDGTVDTTLPGGPRSPGPDPFSPGPPPGRHMPEIGARFPVTVQGRPAGEVLAILPPLESLGWPEGIPRPSLLFVPIAAVLSGTAAYFLFRSVSRRLRRLEEQAERVAAGDLDARVPGLGGDEVGRLAESLNRMTDRLADARRKVAEAEEQRRRFLADAAHELSTPLTTIRGNTETLLDPRVPLAAADQQASLRDILAEAQRMELLVRDLLDLARLEAGAPEPALELVDLSGLARDCVRRFLTAYREAGLNLRGPEDRGAENLDIATVRAAPRRLEQVVENLLLNALRYVPAGGTVQVSVEPRDGEVSLTVEDDGPGFPLEDLPRIFDRFYRADRSRQAGGSGLGLAIVREVVRRHGGLVRAFNHPLGGARVEVRLPASR